MLNDALITALVAGLIALVFVVIGPALIAIIKRDWQIYMLSPRPGEVGIHTRPTGMDGIIYALRSRVYPPVPWGEIVLVVEIIDENEVVCMWRGKLVHIQRLHLRRVPKK
jgi:hypothetical protein